MSLILISAVEFFELLETLVDQGTQSEDNIGLLFVESLVSSFPYNVHFLSYLPDWLLGHRGHSLVGWLLLARNSLLKLIEVVCILHVEHLLLLKAQVVII